MADMYSVADCNRKLTVQSVLRGIEGTVLSILAQHPQDPRLEGWQDIKESWVTNLHLSFLSFFLDSVSSLELPELFLASFLLVFFLEPILSLAWDPPAAGFLPLLLPDLLPAFLDFWLEDD